MRWQAAHASRRRPAQLPQLARIADEAGQLVGSQPLRLYDDLRADPSDLEHLVEKAADRAALAAAHVVCLARNAPRRQQSIRLDHVEDVREVARHGQISHAKHGR